MAAVLHYASIPDHYHGLQVCIQDLNSKGRVQAPDVYPSTYLAWEDLLNTCVYSYVLKFLTQ